MLDALTMSAVDTFSVSVTAEGIVTFTACSWLAVASEDVLLETERNVVAVLLMAMVASVCLGPLQAR
jgi:hypothetical protein